MSLSILMVAHRLPYPPTTGDKVRAYHVARHLAANHRLTLACVADEPLARQHVACLREAIPDIECAFVAPRWQRWSALMQLLTGRSATVAYFNSRTLRRRLQFRQNADVFDLIYVSSSSMIPYSSDRPGIPVLVDFVDVDSDKWLQYAARLPRHIAWIYSRESALLRAVERGAALRADHCLIATEREKETLLSITPSARVTVIPNGVDLEYFSPSPEPACTPNIAFTGAMNYFPNIDAVVHFAEAIFPLVRRQCPEARFLIIGKNPPGVVQRLAYRDNIEVTGSVPDVRPFMRRAAVAVAPLRVARGIQNKILEAMAMGLPVVATPEAHKGIAAEAGRHLFVEDHPAAFAARLVSLLRCPELRARLGRDARAFVAQRHSWPASMAVLDDVLARLLMSPIAAREVPPNLGPRLSSSVDTKMAPLGSRPLRLSRGSQPLPHELG